MSTVVLPWVRANGSDRPFHRDGESGRRRDGVETPLGDGKTESNEWPRTPPSRGGTSWTPPQVLRGKGRNDVHRHFESPTATAPAVRTADVGARLDPRHHLCHDRDDLFDLLLLSQDHLRHMGGRVDGTSPLSVDPTGPYPQTTPEDR